MDINSVAEDLTREAFSEHDNASLGSFLLSIKSASPTIHALVLRNIEKRASTISKVAESIENTKDPAASNLQSPIRLHSLVADQVFQYTPDDLKKIACDVGKNIEGSKDAFHFIYSFITGA